MDLKKKSIPFFIIIFKLKNANFKTLDFSPLIERVLAGVCSVGIKKEHNISFITLKKKCFGSK